MEKTCIKNIYNLKKNVFKRNKLIYLFKIHFQQEKGQDQLNKTIKLSH